MHVLENFWKHLKGITNDTHNYVSKRDLYIYDEEFKCRLNRRAKPPQTFHALVSSFANP
jgi:hypothetical protein